MFAFLRLQSFQKPVNIWLALSLCVSIYYGIATLLYCFSSDYIVQDDTRQHVAFLQRFVDTQLFPNDLIADYFTTVSPPGYQFLYWSIAQLGISLNVAAKVLPLILSLITTIYLYFVSLQILPISINGFLSTLILNQQLWLNDDLVSATPRAFVYPIFSAFLYYLLSKNILACVITIILQGMFFPQLVFVQAVVLMIRLLQPQRRTNLILGITGILAAFLVLLPYALDASVFGNAITATQMRTMPEYGLQGRNEYFGVNWLQFIFLGNSGLRIPLFPSIILAGFALPLLIRSRLPLVAAITGKVHILWQVLLASLGMYGLAHLLLLKLHFPSRYTYHTLRIVLAIAAGIVFTVLLEAGWRWLRRQSQLQIREKLLLGCTVCFAVVVITVPAIPQLFLQFQGWVVGDSPTLYRYLAAQTPTLRIASIALEANNLPIFAQISVLTGREFALPHHPKYYSLFQQTTVDTLKALYTQKSLELIQFIDQYDVDFLLIEHNFMDSNYLLQQDWLFHSSFQSIVLELTNQIQQGVQPIVANMSTQCTAVSTENLILLNAACIKKEAIPIAQGLAGSD